MNEHPIPGRSGVSGGAGRELIESCGGTTAAAVDFVVEFARTLWDLTFGLHLAARIGQDEISGALPPAQPVGQPATRDDHGFIHLDKTALVVRFTDRIRRVWARMVVGPASMPPNDPELCGWVASVTDQMLETLHHRDGWSRNGVFEIVASGWLDTFTLVNALFANSGAPDSTVRYFVMRNLRQTYGVQRTAEVARALYRMARSFNARFAHAGASNHVLLLKELIPALKQAMTKDSAAPPSRQDELAALFVEACVAVRYVRAARRKAGYVEIKTDAVDAEHLIGNLFGIPTGIQGFDELFGSGGIILAEGHPLTDTTAEPAGHASVGAVPSLSETAATIATATAMGGRAILIRGRFGTGKSLLSIQLAAEVAGKGGVAWLMPLEQSAEEYLYILESAGNYMGGGGIVVATDAMSAADVLSNPRPGRGALIILRTVKDNYGAFLEAFTHNAAQMRNYPLRLIGVDPVNAISRGPSQRPSELRTATMDAIARIKRDGTNVLLVAEEGTAAAGDVSANVFRFEENVADTVIHMSLGDEPRYAQRFFEIIKSRLQREQRGRHPFSIVPGRGIAIYCSPAAVSARIRARKVPDRNPVEFGLPSLHPVLGNDAIPGGGVVVLQGPGGTFKTRLGLAFLLGLDQRRDRGTTRVPGALVVSARDDAAAVRHALRRGEFKLGGPEGRSRHAILVCEIPRGWVHPGYILERIRAAFEDAWRDGVDIARVMVDNIGHWEVSNPFVGEDPTFGDTLVDFLRRQSATSLLICGEPSAGPADARGGLQRPVIDRADCLIELRPFEFRGTQRVMLRVRKTRSMRHRRELFEVVLADKALEVRPITSLLRLTADGKVEPVSVRLFLHAETAMQYEYNRTVEETLSAVLSRATRVESQDRMSLNRAMSLSPESAVDELQLLQMDEFQIPAGDGHDDLASANATAAEHGTAARDLALRVFPPGNWDPQKRNALVGDLEQRVSWRPEGFVAVPYYGNISLLAYHALKLAELKARYPAFAVADVLGDWKVMEHACAAWEADHPLQVPDGGADDRRAVPLFFEFPRATSENYNSLFFEILLSFAPPPAVGLGACRLSEWLGSEAAITAGRIFRRLCRRAYLSEGMASRLAKLQPGRRGRHQRGRPSTSGLLRGATIRVSRNAVIWRHWYSTLNQMMFEFAPEERNRIRVCRLPGKGVTTAGEWYLGVPAHSAAPDVALRLIDLLTSPESEAERLRLGVGLPTRAAFYAPAAGAAAPIELSRYFTCDELSLHDLMRGAFRRSMFGCYAKFSRLLSSHLQRLIELPDADLGHADPALGAADPEAIRTVFEQFRQQIRLIDPNPRCSRCADGRVSKRTSASGPASS